MSTQETQERLMNQAMKYHDQKEAVWKEVITLQSMSGLMKKHNAHNPTEAVELEARKRMRDLERSQNNEN